MPYQEAWNQTILKETKSGAWPMARKIFQRKVVYYTNTFILIISNHVSIRTPLNVYRNLTVVFLYKKHDRLLNITVNHLASAAQYEKILCGFFEPQH